MNACIVVISYRFNFFAEPCLKMAVATDLPVFLFQAHKSETQLASMEVPEQVVTCLRYAKMDLQHAQILDDFLIRRTFPPLMEFDTIIFLDHDCLMSNDHFFKCVEECDKRIREGKVLIARGERVRHENGLFRDFHTIPLFAVSTRYNWPTSWHIIKTKTGPDTKRFYDTGQRISESLNKSNDEHLMDLTAGNFMNLDWWLHWGSGWGWIHHFGDQALAKARKHYLELAQTGIWSIDEEEYGYASPYVAFDEMLKVIPRKRCGL